MHHFRFWISDFGLSKDPSEFRAAMQSFVWQNAYLEGLQF